MATEAARLKRKNPQQGGKRKTDRKRKTDLTLTGLLMEGISPPLPGYDKEPRPQKMPPKVSQEMLTVMQSRGGERRKEGVRNCTDARLRRR
jgi:hypothetical protein